MHSLFIQFKRPIANFVNEIMVMTKNEQADLTRMNDVQHRMRLSTVEFKLLKRICAYSE